MTAQRTVVFVCEHGAAKSIIAAAYLQHLAAAEGIPITALARGTDPEPVVSPIAVAGLQAAGLSIPDHNPRRPSPEELSLAAAIVSFGPTVVDLPVGAPIHRWPDIPAVSDGFVPARDAIVDRLRGLLVELHPSWST